MLYYTKLKIIITNKTNYKEIKIIYYKSKSLSLTFLMSCFVYIKLLSFGGGRQLNNKSNSNLLSLITQVKTTL